MRLIAIFSLVFIFISCTHNKLKIRDKKKHIIHNSYEKIDEIYIENYVLCNNINRWKRNEMVKINEDSILNIFNKALEKTKINIIRNEKENFCDNHFHYNIPLKLSKVDTKIIINSPTNDSRIRLFPIIYINNLSLKNIYITSSGIAGGGEYLRDTFLTIVIYLIKDSEIIYLKSARYGPISSETVTYDEKPPKQLEQEHWDKLVELVMRDYIKRLK
jgi:hypothetical protein